jgi:peptide/nickel transport system permease protein
LIRASDTNREETVLETNATPNGGVSADTAALTRPEKPLAEFWHRFSANRGAVIGVFALLLVFVMAIAAPTVAPYAPEKQLTGKRLEAPSSRHLMGTDNFGRDVFSRVVYGARITFSASLVAIVIAVGIGVPLGLAAGYAGKATDSVIMRSMDILLAFPGILLALAVVAILGNGLVPVEIAVGVSLIAAYVRLVRASVLSAKENLYVEAARVNGCSGWRIAASHIFPNIATPILVLSTTAIGWAVVIAAEINFLNLGVQPPTAEWGADLAASRTYLRQGWWMGTFPGLAIMIVILAANLIGDGLQEALDPRMRGREVR